MEEKSNIRNENPILEKLKRETDIMQSELKIKTASGGKQSLKNSMDGKLKLDHLDRRQLLDKQESQQQCRCEGLSDKAELQLHASVEAVLEKSAERVPRFGFSKDTV